MTGPGKTSLFPTPNELSCSLLKDLFVPRPRPPPRPPRLIVLFQSFFLMFLILLLPIVLGSHPNHKLL